MAYWILATYTRPNTGVAWFSPSADVITTLNEYKGTEPKKIEHYEVKESADGLKQYVKLGFVDQAESLNFKDSPAMKANEEARENYLDNSGVTVLIEDRGPAEPTI